MRAYTTAEVAAIIGIHPNTVRLYEQWGLITRPARKENGYRIFTELQIRQILLARTAFQVEVLQNGLRKKIVEMLKTAAQCDFSGAMRLTNEYLALLHREQARAEEAIVLANDILSGGVPESEVPRRRKEISDFLDITMDTLRNWEMNGLLTIKRKQNGYRVYTAEDVRRLKIIRSLRCANYSLEAILRMLRQLSCNPDTDLRTALNAPEQSESVISVCDKLLVSFAAAEENTKTLLGMVQDMKHCF